MADRMGLLLVVEGLSEYKNATVTVKKLNGDVAASMTDVEKTSGPAQVGVGKLAAAFSLGSIAASAAMKVFNAVAQTAKKLVVTSTGLAARYDELAAVIKVVGENTGHTLEEMEEFEDALRDTGITAVGSREALISMAQAGVDLAYATDLARVAQNAAIPGMMDSTEAFESLIYAISRGRTQVAKTIGLNVDFVKAESQLAKQLGKTRKELSESEVMQARYTEVMRASESIAGAYEAAMTKAGKQARSLRRYTEDLGVALGEAFLPTYGEIVFGLKEFLGDLTKVVEDNQEEIVELGVALGDLAGEFIELKDAVPLDSIGTFIERLTTLIRLVQVGTSEVKGFAEGVDIAGTSLAKWARLAWIGVDAWGGVMDKLTGMRKEYEQAIEVEEKETRIINELAGRTEDLANEMRDLKTMDDAVATSQEKFSLILSKTTEDLEKQGEAIAKLKLDLQRDYADALIEAERDALRREIEIAQDRADLARETAKSIEDAYADAEKERAEAVQEAAESVADFEQDAAQEWADLERDAARERERIDVNYARRKEAIERNLVRRLRDIQQQFEMDVQDAARTRDAFALVQAQRRAQREREEAQEAHDDQLADAQTNYNQQVEDYQTALEQQQEDLRRSLAEQREDLEESLAERQAAIEQRLQEELASIQQRNQEELADMDRRLAREREMEALQAQWEEEDRRRRLERQLQDMEIQYGDLYGITAAGLMEQVEEWADAYGPDGAAAHLVTNFADLVEEETERMRDAMVDMANTWLDAMQTLSQLGFAPQLPQEFQFQSPKLGLQVGLERLEKYLSTSVFAGGQLPAVGQAAVSRTESYFRSESQHSVDVNVPNLDVVVQRQLLGIFGDVLQGVQ